MPVLHQAIASIFGAAISAIIALLILPMLEHTFAITTDISLLEFSDLGHPLLQRLALEAPGTYHHSLVVANLAQAAAESIGANGLEARVCSYFHDIGKLTKPNFFAENIHMQHNPHDDIPPSMSTLVIIAHVKEGLSLAMLNNLPKPVMRAISEHHGTSMLRFFHNKAQTQLEFEMDTGEGSTPKVDEGSFRYPGPKPSTKVSAIIGLADAAEAASRSIEKTSPGHIESLVKDIVHARIDDGQLDDCDLSMKDIAKIKRTFVFTLTNMLHGRIPYPKDDNKNKQQAKQPSREQPADKNADNMADKSDTET
jgi:putative nucleotidyltransferase with HDIG domain